jgi:hypothetical protein
VLASEPVHVGLLIREAPPSRLDVLAAKAGMTADELRDRLRREVERRRNSGAKCEACSAAKPVVESE